MLKHNTTNTLHTFTNEAQQPQQAADPLKQANEQFTDLQWRTHTPSLRNGGRACHVSDFTIVGALSEIKVAAGSPHKRSHITFRITKDIVTQMGWAEGDKILICDSPTMPGVLCFLRNDNGYTLSLEHNSKEKAKRIQVVKIRFKGDAFLESGVEFFPSTQLRYEAHPQDNRLFVQLPPEATRDMGNKA